MRTFLAALLLLLLAGEGKALEQIGFSDVGSEVPVKISADRLQNAEGNVVKALGDVRIEWADRTLTAQEISYDRTNRFVEARGDVRIGDAVGNEMRCESAKLNLSDMTGSTEKAELYLPEMGYRVRAAKISRTGPDTFEADDATFTACDGTWPSWRVEAGWLKVELDGYLYGKNGIFWLESLPATYLPFFAFPAKLTRQTGLLPPRFGSSQKDGLIFIDRFYWVISESADLTFLLDYRTRRGWSEEARVRYVLDENQEGSIKLRSYKDRRGDNTEKMDVLADHMSLLSKDTLFEYHVDYTGDPKSRINYGDDLEARGIRRAESHASLAHALSPGTAYAMGRFTQPFAQPQSEVMQELPAFGFWGAETPLWGPLFSKTDTEAVRFYREEGLQGNRLRLSQEFALDADAGGFGLTASAGYRQHLYDVLETSDSGEEQKGAAARGAAWTEARLRTALERSWDGYIHRVEPFVGYRWAEAGRGGDAPFFDDEDKFTNESRVIFGIESRLNNEAGARKLLLDVERSLNVGVVRDEGWGEEAWGPWRAEMELSLFDRVRLAADGDYDPGVGNGWLRWAAEASVSSADGDRIWWKEQYLQSEASYMETGLSFGMFGWLNTAYKNRYSRKDRQILEDRVDMTYRHPCWETQLSFSRLFLEDEGVYDRRVFVTLSLQGMGRAGALRW